METLSSRNTPIEKLFKQALDSVEVGVVLCDAYDRLIYANDSAARLLAGEIDLSPGRRLADRLREAAAGGQEIRWGDRWLSLSLRSLADGAGMLTVSDVTERRAAEERAARSAHAERRLQDAIENTNEGFVLYDEDDRLVMANANYTKLLVGSLDMEQYIGQTFETILRDVVNAGMVDEIGEDPEVWIAERLRKHQAANQTVMLHRDNGRRIMINERRVASGGIVGVFTDLTDLLQAREALRRNEAELQMILDATPAIFAMKDREGRYLRTNRAMERYFSLKPGAAIGKTDHDLFPPEVANRFMAADERVAATGEPETVDDIVGEGEDLRATRTVRFPVRDQFSNEIYAIAWIATDETERLRQQRALDESREQLQSILDNTPALIMVKTEDGRYAISNRAHDHFRGVPTGALIGKRDQDSEDKETNESIRKSEQWILTTRQKLSYEDSRILDGEKRWFMVNKFPLIDQADQAYAVGTVASDITEIRKREEHLARANEQITASIRYASRIQNAMLPSNKQMRRALPEHFIVWEPRDIVGGDFYWVHEAENGVYLVVGDCTGHGAPGAFMTLIACGVFDRWLRTMDRPSPGELLTTAHSDLQLLLGQNEATGLTDDGLEAGICLIEPGGERLTFAGARFSLFQAGTEGVCEIKGDKAGVGFFQADQNPRFADKTVEIENGDFFYMATDGLIDQIGGPKRLAFGKRRFRAFIEAHHQAGLEAQKETLLREIVQYQGDETRRDDVTVLGFRT